MHYINDLTDGSSVREIYLCKKRQALVTRAGKSYESLTFQDKTGTIDAKIWDPDSMGIGEFGEMDYVDVSGEVITYQGHLQLNVRRARLCHEAVPGSATRESMILLITCLSPSAMSRTCTGRS